MGHPIRFGPWKNDRCLRLFRRDLGRYVGADRSCRSRASAAARVGRLRERLTHYTCDSYSQYLPKVSRYADVQARIWHAEGRRAKLSAIAAAIPAAICARLRVAAGIPGRPRRAAGVRAGGVPVVVEAGVSVATAKRPRLARGRPTRVRLPACHSALPWIAAVASTADAHRGEHWQSQWHPSRQSRAAQAASFAQLRHRLTPAWLQHRRPPAAAQYLLPPARHSALLHAADRHARADARRAKLLAVCRRARAAAKSAAHVSADRRVTTASATTISADSSSRTNCAACWSSRSRPRLLDCSKRIATSRKVTLLQAAIAEQEGTRELVLPPRRGLDGGVVRPRPLAPARHPRSRKSSLSQSPATRWRARCAPPGSTQVDLIQIDAEGYDWPIIRSIDFDACGRDHSVRISAHAAARCRRVPGASGITRLPLRHRSPRHHCASIAPSSSATLAPPQRRSA